MDLMEKAKKRALLPIDEEYVFNHIYFGEEGLTSSSANHISAMANVMVQDIEKDVIGLRLYEKHIRVIGAEEVTVDTVNNTLAMIDESVWKICKVNSLIAWLREAMKEKDKAQDYIHDLKLEKWMEMQGIQKPECPKQPEMPHINFKDFDTMLDAGLSVKEYNRFLKLNSMLAVYGKFVHENGLLTRQKAELKRIAQNPTEVKENGRDTIIISYKADIGSEMELNNLYTKLQSEYRKLQAEKNGIESKYINLAMAYQQRKMDEWKDAKAQFDRDLEKVGSLIHDIEIQMREWKKQKLEELAALKIIIPNDLMEVYKYLCEKYL